MCIAGSSDVDIMENDMAVDSSLFDPAEDGK